MLCVFQVIYIGCSYATVYLIYLKFKATYDGNHDTFRVEFLVVPVGGLAFLVNHDFSPLEVRNTEQIHFASFIQHFECAYKPPRISDKSHSKGQGNVDKRKLLLLLT